MKKIFILSLLLVSIPVLSQQKYQSLLWKISGNGLQKDSYLYGTMHVSSKVAFRLDDVFYESLLASDAVALESDPTTWMEHSYELMQSMPYYPDMGFGYVGEQDFYSNHFSFHFPNELAVRTAIRFDSNIINGYLYRKSPAGDNFEEETYLDMFIFQAGKKQDKPIIGLEDFKESQSLVTKASYNIAKKKIDAWLLKKYKEHNAFDLTEEAYRNRDLDLLDSIGKATNTEHFRKYMLYQRNHNMAEVLDSLMPIQSVFTGVGAAHLPGEQGMIELLRKKGYTVTPLSSKQTGFGKLSKDDLEAKFVKPAIEMQSTDDGFLQINSFEKLRELNFLGQKYYIATDMANGAYLAITRINTFEYLKNKEEDLLKDIDHLLFEDIPGDILSKTYFTHPYPGVSIQNKTKKGDHQRYAIYKTPLELIIVKLGGKQDYVLTYGDEIFNSITFKSPVDSWVAFQPAYKKYHFSIPSNYIAENYCKEGRKIVQAQQNDDFYFFQEVPINDTEYIEEDKFEASYIHKAFLKTYDLEPAPGVFKDGDFVTYTTNTTIDSLSNKKISLQSIVKDESYYLMGHIGIDSSNAARFFNSFQLDSIQYQQEVEQVIDTSLYFSVNTMVQQPFPTAFFGYHQDKRKSYEQSIKTTRYATKTNEVITVKRTKFHDMQMYENIDSLWNSLKKPVMLAKPYTKVFEKKSAAGDLYTYSYFLRDSLSKKQIRVKNIVKKGTLFELKTLEDVNSEGSKFVNNFFDSFSVKDTLLGEDLFVDKVPRFLAALKANDSIVMSSYYLLKYKKTHASMLMDFLKTFDFPKDKKMIRNTLVSKLVELDDPNTTAFMKDLYAQSYNEPQIQITILRSLMQRKDENSYQMVLALLNNDFPVSNHYNISSLFMSPFHKDSLNLKKKLFPELLKYSTINEYKKPIYNLLSKLKTQKLIKPKEYRKYKDQLLNDARLELKRNLFNEDSQQQHNNRGYRTFEGTLLESYVNLLYPFKEEKEVHGFFTRLVESNDADALTTYYALLRKNNEAQPLVLSNKLMKEAFFSTLIDKLDFYQLKNNFLNGTESWSAYAKSKIYNGQSVQKDSETISFLKEEKIKMKDQDVVIYFFKLTKNNPYDTNNTYLHYMAFKIKNGALVTKPVVASDYSGELVDEMTTEKELIERIVDQVRYKDRKRLSGRSYEHEQYFGIH